MKLAFCLLGIYFCPKFTKQSKMSTEKVKMYEELSVTGLIGDLYQKMQIIRPGISRNTIRLAFVQGGTTKLRRRILGEAKQLLETHRASDALEV